jgi:GntR family transcriptional regulator
MAWDLQSDRPIYLQLMEKLQLQIICGVYPPGGKLPSVRDLAAEAAVNPNTMQKALSELERMGLVFSQRTSGRFITEDTDMIQNMKNDMAKQQILDFLKNMEKIGYDKESAIQVMMELAKEME